METSEVCHHTVWGLPHGPSGLHKRQWITCNVISRARGILKTDGRTHERSQERAAHSSNEKDPARQKGF